MALHQEKDRALFYPRAWVYVRSRNRHRLAEQKLNALRARLVDVVVVPRLSRLAVHRQWLGWMLRMFHKHDVTVATIECELRYDLYRHGLDGVLL